MLTIQLKRLGKKKIKTLNFDIKKTPETLEELIEQCVISEIKKFNNKRENLQLQAFLTPQNIQEQSEKGKIGFGAIENKTLAIEADAISNAKQGFLDGLFLVFINDNEIKALNETIIINKESTIAFMRMTFLSGTYW